MAARRELVSWFAEYGSILNFTVLKPMKSKFDLELKEDLGGNADLELLKILRKVQKPRIIRKPRILLHLSSL
jgi:hypothetical protein